MSYSSNAVKRLQHLYNVIFKRMKFNEWLYEHGLFGRMRNASRPISALEQLEPRVFLSATTMPTDDLVLHWTADALVAGKLEDTSGYGNAYGTL
ncbi:MAG TPA: LEPR-XLL domain-containing protein, partial [Phycisphaerae bacterium]|nr:LEPR-XLL domain-containing protein [Phycisphaerae bacterium]